MNSNCSNLLDMRNLQKQVKKAFCYQKLKVFVRQSCARHLWYQWYITGVRKYRPLHVCHEHGVFRTLVIVILMIASRVMTIRTTIVQPYHQTISYIFSRSFWHKPTHCDPVMSNFDLEFRSNFFSSKFECSVKGITISRFGEN